MLSHLLLARGATVPTRSRTRPTTFDDEVRANRLREFHQREAAQRGLPQRFRRPPATAPNLHTR